MSGAAPARGLRSAWCLVGPYRVIAGDGADEWDREVVAAVERLLNGCAVRLRCSCGWGAEGRWDVAQAAHEHQGQDGEHQLSVDFGGSWWPLQDRVESVGPPAFISTRQPEPSSTSSQETPGKTTDPR